MIEVRMKTLDWRKHACWEHGFFVDVADGKRVCHKCREIIDRGESFLLAYNYNLCETCMKTAFNFIVDENARNEKGVIVIGKRREDEDIPVQL